MGQLHNELRRTPLSVALKAELGDTRAGSGLERYGETLTPIIDQWALPERAWLRHEWLWVGHIAQSAIVGEFSMAAITSPLDGNLLVIVDRIAAAVGVAAAELQVVEQTRAAIAATLTAFALTGRDSRQNRNELATNPTVPVEGWSGSDAAGFGNILERQLTATAFVTTDLFSPPFVLKPGTGVLVQGATVNQILRVTFVGRARMAQAGELE